MAGAEARRRPDLALSWSGGKDSALALWSLREAEGVLPAALLTTVTETFDRISMHGVRRSLLRRQAESVGVPLVEIEIPPACSNDVYESRMADAFASAPLAAVEEVAFGDLFLQDIRSTARAGWRPPAGGRRSRLGRRHGGPRASLPRRSAFAPFSSASTRARSTRRSPVANTTSGCSPTCPRASTRAGRTASSTRSSTPDRLLDPRLVRSRRGVERDGFVFADLLDPDEG